MKRNKMILLALMLALTAVLAACTAQSSQDEDDTPTQTTEDGTQQTPEETVEDETVDEIEEPDADSSAEDETEEVSAPAAGTWRLYGSQETAYLVLDGQGHFEHYDAEGTLETKGTLVYEEDAGRYDMYDASGSVCGSFYLDTDVQLHMADNADAVYYLSLDGGESQPALRTTLTFTGLTSVESTQSADGYRYIDRTEDGLTTIYNLSFATDETDAEAVVAQAVTEAAGQEAQVVVVAERDSLAEQLGQSAWRFTCQSESGVWDGVLVLDEGRAYVYAFVTDADNAAAMAETFTAAFDGLSLS